MNIVDILAQAQGGQGLESLGRQFGLNEAQTRAAVEALAPVVAAGVSRNASTGGGLADLIGAVLQGNHSRYADDPNATQFDAVAEDGNAILGHIFGSKDVSRGVAMQAAGSSGIGAAILKKMLPVIASMVMGVLAKKMFGGRAANAGTGGGGLGDILGDILGGGQGRAPQQQQSPGGGGLGDILKDILGGGAAQAPDPQQQSPGGGGLGDILKDILGGGANVKVQKIPPGANIEDILKDILGGGNPEVVNRGRGVVDESLGRPRTRGANPADDMLNSVEEAIRRR